MMMKGCGTLPDFLLIDLASLPLRQLYCCLGAGCVCAHRLLPHVEKIVRAAADPELREVATNALSLLERVSREGQEAAAEPAANKVDWQVRGVA